MNKTTVSSDEILYQLTHLSEDDIQAGEAIRKRLQEIRKSVPNGEALSTRQLIVELNRLGLLTPNQQEQFRKIPGMQLH